MPEHFFEVSVQWTGNAGTGTSGYKDYRRDNELSAGGKQIIAGSADKAFHGDRSRWNPEELLIAALSQCHMLSFLHVASAAARNSVAFMVVSEGRRGLGPASPFLLSRI